MNVEEEINDLKQKIQKLEEKLSEAVGEGKDEKEIAIRNQIIATRNELTELREIHEAQKQGKNFEFSDVCQISSNLTLIVEFYFNVLWSWLQLKIILRNSSFL
jgi:ATP-dependent Clp protease ATP-binding subunit ClpA